MKKACSKAEWARRINDAVRDKLQGNQRRIGPQLSAPSLPAPATAQPAAQAP